MTSLELDCSKPFVRRVGRAARKVSAAPFRAAEALPYRGRQSALPKRAANERARRTAPLTCCAEVHRQGAPDRQPVIVRTR